MFVASIPKNDVGRLAGEGCVVNINGKPETVKRNGDCLCWREEVRPILEELRNGSGVMFVCGDQEGGEYHVIDALETRKHVLPKEPSDEKSPYYWIAINQASCAMSSIPMPDVPKVTPTPQGLIGFPTLAAAKAAQELCLTAPIPEVAEAIDGWRGGKDGAVVVDCDNPEPPQPQTVWSTQGTPGNSPSR